MKLFDFTGPKDWHRWNDLTKWMFSGPMMSYTTVPNDHNASGAEVPLPDHRQEAWLQYECYFPKGFDFGRNDKAHSVGGKMPGLGSRGPHAQLNGKYTGGSHDDQGFSGRLMWRGHNSAGQSFVPADGIVLSLYAYELEGKQRSYWFKDRNEVNPPIHAFDGDNNGTGPGGIGDRDAWMMPVDTWFTVTLGYGVGDEHFFEAWIDGERKLRLDGDFRWMAWDAEQKIDTLLFQSYWGGDTEAWLPTSRTTFSYRNMSVYDSSPLDSQPVDKEGGVDTKMGGDMYVEVTAEGSTGSEELELRVNGVKCPRRMVVGTTPTTFKWEGLRNADGIELAFVNDGTDAMDRDRNVQLLTSFIYVDGRLHSIHGDDPELISTAAHIGGKCVDVPVQNSENYHGGFMACEGSLFFAGAIRSVSNPQPTDIAADIHALLRDFPLSAQIKLLAEVLVLLSSVGDGEVL